MLHMADTQTEWETASKARWKQIASMVSRTMQNKNTLRESHVHTRNIMYTDKTSLSLPPSPLSPLFPLPLPSRPLLLPLSLSLPLPLSPPLSLSLSLSPPPSILFLTLSLSPQTLHLMEDRLTFKKTNIAPCTCHMKQASSTKPSHIANRTMHRSTIDIMRKSAIFLFMCTYKKRAHALLSGGIILQTNNKYARVHFITIPPVGILLLLRYRSDNIRNYVYGN